MTAKEYLLQYRQIEREIDRLLEDRARWESLAEKVTPTPSKAPGGSGSGDRVGMAAAKIVDLQREIDARVAELIALRRQIVSFIHRLPPSQLRDVLMLRYLCRCTWEQAAGRMGVSRQWAMTLHKQALAELENSEER